ncbi:DUF3034 family protein [Piscinibacter gummiphilus]|uniref:DUF3034 family protein n=1 Tax=Piscinibacter gummiphilus TaxID=946333 RepID=A0ABZ0CQ64_9BURK|nr:DUF3034 family protein [Piscinibacter gummiphilus]WOB07135.1 DUF3034 family protein [Piscinibacter gummiphilus]
MPRHHRLAPCLAGRLAITGALALACASPSAWAVGGKLLLTGGVSSIDGAAGGGLTPWAVTGGYGTAGEIGGSAFATRVKTQDFSVNAYGAALAYGDRIELSFARQSFDTGPVGTTLSMPGLKLRQDIVGVKLRVFGDAVLDSDTWAPQVALGVQHKTSDAGALESTLASFGAKDSGTDVYVSATKLFLAPGLLVNGTLRATKANQNGLLGFGATGHTSYRLQPEVSLAWLLRRDLAIGAEYRAKPDNFRDNTALGAGALNEDDWADVFVAWAPSKHFSLTLAYVDAGKIVPGVVNKRQTGAYLSAQVAF